MDRWMGAKEVAGILGYKDLDVVRRIMREMVHMEQPLRVTEGALQEWCARRTYRPASTALTSGPFDRADDMLLQEIRKKDRIPRRRGGKMQT